MRKRMWMPSPAMTWTCGILCALAACADGGDPAALAGLAAHAVVRRLELRADRFAIEHAGGSDVLRTCLEQQFRRSPFALDAPLWQVLLLHRMPTPACRLAQAGSRNGKTA